MSMVLECKELYKQYGSIRCLGDERQGLSFNVEQGELFAIIGASGCGKSTLLRIVGGFVQPTAGSVIIDGRTVTGFPPHRRPTNMVFQNYALFPHMTVRGNVSFGLEMERVPFGEREKRVAEALNSVGLADLGGRHIGELSGGQMQRAALARALVKRPKVVLLDEPLGALDLKLRRQMQDEIVRLKQNLGMTIMHVTHDQEEACAMADRIAVLNAGKILQIDRPVDLFSRPRTAFVAEFIGAGTVIRGEIARDGDQMSLSGKGLRAVGGFDPDLGTKPVACLFPKRGASIMPIGGSGSWPNFVVGKLFRLAFSGIDYTAQVITEDDVVASVQLSMEQVESMQVALDDMVMLTWKHDQIRFIGDDDVQQPKAIAPAFRPRVSGSVSAS